MIEPIPRYFGAIDGQSESGDWVHVQDYLALEKRLAEAEAKIPRWIPVGERLPEPGTCCHIWDDDEFIAFAYFEKNGKWSDGESPDDGWFEYTNVTHWMPLIPNPTEGE